MTETRSSCARATPLGNSDVPRTTPSCDQTPHSTVSDDDHGRSGTAEEDREQANSPLFLSLLGCANAPGTFTEEASDEHHIPTENNPRPLCNEMGDRAEYWVDGNGELLHLKFMAKLAFDGQFSQLGPYFSLPDSGVSDDTDEHRMLNSGWLTSVCK